MVTTKKQVYFLVTAAMMISLLYFYFDPANYHFFPPCPFYYLTGFFCPGCGSQRAFHDILHGDILHAARHNVLLVILSPLLLFALFSGISNIFRKKKIGQGIFYSPWFAWLLVVVILLFWILRNLPVYPFTLLAP